MSTHPKRPLDTYICSNPGTKHLSARPGLCKICAYSKHTNPRAGQPNPKTNKEPNT